ncbi:MAG: 4Fe-4S binding protein [Planctomycetes bacterium]|nr:4Fe-4S binding protein [Planctomycetota bacterium]
MGGYTIREGCIGCTVCAKRCPTEAITGSTKKMHYIDPELCIDCGVCGSYCPVDCIYDQFGQQTFMIKQAKNRPLAVVLEENCTGCEACVIICPFDCLAMKTGGEAGHFFTVSYLAKPKACVACKLCEVACSDKEAIKVVWPDKAGKLDPRGEPLLSFNQPPSTLVS